MAFIMSIAAGLLLAAPASQAPTGNFPPPDDCQDDRGVDRCKPEEQRRIRALYGVKAIGAHRDAGDQVRRAFFVDGYGRDLIAVEFIRPKGADPMLRVHFPAKAGEERVPTMTAAVDGGRWSDLLRRSTLLDRGPLPPRETENPVICLHSWVYTVEASDTAGAPGQAGTVRRRTEDACNYGPTAAFASELAAMAVPLLPPCALLDRDQHRNEAALLASCRYLRGDRLAAAGVLNRLDALRKVRKQEDLALLRPLFGPRASIDWAGEVHAGGNSAAFWLRKVEEAKAHFYVEEVMGETADRVRVRGRLYRSVGEDEATRSEAAKAELVWSKRAGTAGSKRRR
jgi:hypothetical protein